MVSQALTVSQRYLIDTQLGVGGMGTVYAAKDRLTDEMVALKLVHVPLQNLSFQSKEGTDGFSLALAKEFRVLSTLRHPHIISVYDYGFTSNKAPYFTMELLDKPIKITEVSPDLPPVEKIKLIIQLLQALGYLHRRGIMHQDIKPSNVMVVDEQVKVLDFGVVREHAAEIPEIESSYTGTLTYMAPELFQGRATTCESELWAVGVLMYEMFAGEYPFYASNIMDAINRIKTDQPIFDKLPVNDTLIHIIQKLLAKDPAQRFHSAYDVIPAICQAADLPVPPESARIRESFLQAARFVGRQAELNQLIDALPEDVQTPGSVWLLGGESGVGKSRLAEELRSRALVNGVMVLRGRANESGGLPYQLWRDIIRHLLLTQSVSDLQAGVLKEIVPDIERLLDRPIMDVPKLEGPGHQHRLIFAIIDLLHNLRQPLLLLLEDLQWVDESLPILQQILQASDQMPGLMILGTYQHDERPELVHELANAKSIILARLNDNEIMQLSEAILGEQRHNPQIATLLQEETEGNMFFIVEIMRALAEESGSVNQIGAKILPDRILTGGMKQLMRRRLNKVDAQYKDMQTLAALIGREIDTRLLQHHYNAKSVLAWLVNAADAAVIEVQENTWRFAHDKLRETITADIHETERAILHGKVAETIETVYANSPSYHEALLYHWRMAGNLDKELYYLDSVAEDMIELRGIYESAQALLENALTRLPEHDARRVSVLNWLARQARRRGQYAETTQYANQAQTLAQNAHDFKGVATSLHNLAIIAMEQGDYDKATDLFEESLVIQRKLDDQSGIGTSLNVLGIIAYFQSEYEQATTLFEQSLAIRQKLGERQGVAMCLLNLGLIAHSQGDYEKAIDFYQQSLDIVQQVGDERLISLCLNNLGTIAHAQSDYEKAIDLVLQSLAIKKRMGNLRGVSSGLNNLGLIAMEQEDYERAIDFHQQSLAIQQKLGDQGGISLSLFNLAFNAYFQTNYAKSTSLFEQSLAIQQELGDGYGMGNSLVGLGLVALKQDHASAADRFVQALVIVSKINAIPLVLECIIGLAGVLLNMGQAKRAGALIGLAQTHPGHHAGAKRVIDSVLPQIESALSPDELNEALEQGTSLDLETVVAELLEEFGTESQ